MSFQQGVYSDIHDLANSIRVFAVANSWIEDKYIAGSGVGHSYLYLHQGTQYVSLDFFLLAAASRIYHGIIQNIERPGILIYGNTGFNTLNAFDDQPGNNFLDTGKTCLTNWVLSPGRYWFFTNATGDYIHVVMETAPSEYVYLMFGKIENQGTHSGGAYIAGHAWDHSLAWFSSPSIEFHNVPFDANTDTFNGNFTHVRTDLGGSTWHHATELDLTWGPDDQILGDVRAEAQSRIIYLSNLYTTSIPPMATIILYYLRPSSALRRVSFDFPFGTILHALGHVKDVRNTSIEKVDPGETLSLGPDDWLIFPLARKGDPADYNDQVTMNSGYMALSFKKIL